MSLVTWIPSRLRVRWNGIRSDAAALRGAIRGPSRPVIHVPHTAAELEALLETARREQARRRAALDTATAGLLGEARDLEVVAVERPTADAVTIGFRNPPDAPVSFRPGQFLTLVVEHEGETLRRAYSLCSDPADRNRLAVTVKRVEGGRVSNLLNDTVAVGDRFRTFGPSGRFGPAPSPRAAGAATGSPRAARHIVLAGAGAGITPLFSILQALSAAEPASSIELVYGNRRLSDVIFREELDRLAAERPNVRVTHVLTRPPRGWRGPRGRLAGDRLAAVLPVDAAAEYYVCGPEGMMQGVVAFLRDAGIPDDRVHVERFLRHDDDAARRGTGAVYEVRFARSGVTLSVPDTKTVLEAGLEAGLPLAYSCTMGGCAACKVRVLEGEVAQEEPNALTNDERARGERLACVGRPRSALVVDA